MYKGECINPQINKMLSEMGHTDLLCVCDAGLPIPKQVERIDLAWKKDSPKWLDVCRLIKDNIYIQKIYLSEEIKTESTKLNKDFIDMLDGLKVEIIYLKHDTFKGKISGCKSVVRTGEYTPFANCIIECGAWF